MQNLQRKIQSSFINPSQRKLGFALLWNPLLPRRPGRCSLAGAFFTCPPKLGFVADLDSLYPPQFVAYSGRDPATTALTFHLVRTQIQRIRDLENRLFDTSLSCVPGRYLQNTIMETARNEGLRDQLKRAKEDREQLNIELSDLEEDHLALQNELVAGVAAVAAAAAAGAYVETQTDTEGFISLMTSGRNTEQLPASFESSADAIAAIDSIQREGSDSDSSSTSQAPKRRLPAERYSLRVYTLHLNAAAGGAGKLMATRLQPTPGRRLTAAASPSSLSKSQPAATFAATIVVAAATFVAAASPAPAPAAAAAASHSRDSSPSAKNNSLNSAAVVPIPLPQRRRRNGGLPDLKDGSDEEDESDGAKTPLVAALAAERKRRRCGGGGGCSASAPAPGFEVPVAGAKRWRDADDDDDDDDGDGEGAKEGSLQDGEQQVAKRMIVYAEPLQDAAGTHAPLQSVAAQRCEAEDGVARESDQEVEARGKTATAVCGAAVDANGKGRV
ncbi:hypothetical protein DFJ73DRAFT_767456 [Zopfochytrium polystomum]|nr:hypothetical protein DFJ73DRAFT_767456 [Zopfochytrium polystomum]